MNQWNIYLLFLLSSAFLFFYLASTFQNNKLARQSLSLISVSILIIASFMQSVLIDSFIGWLLLFVLFFWIATGLSISINRYHIKQIKNTKLKSTLYLFILAMYFVLVQGEMIYFVNDNIVHFSYSIAVMLAALTALYYRLVATKKYDFIDPGPQKGKKPSVTLAIPARNETHALEDTLHSAIQSDYEKLEILVLDDCSQDKTAQIIKSFAHDGVRFVQGEQPSDTWIGKNKAYDVLSEHASGEFIIFTGVDVALSETSISQLIDYMDYHNLDMASVLPIRNKFDFMANFLQPMRYFRLLSYPRIYDLPPVLSSCWVIRAERLNKLGGFNAVKNMIIPEEFFAREIKKDDKYHFLISNPQLGVSTRKKLNSQIDTATRTIYPQLHRSAFLACLNIILYIGLYILPFILPIYYLMIGEFQSKHHIFTLAAIIILASHALLNLKINKKSWYLSFINFPFAMILEIIIIFRSFWAYEFGDVQWKGRSVCIPVMTRHRKT